jgi:hypothetical protein
VYFQANFGTSAEIRPWPIPSKSFSVVHLYILLRSDATQSVHWGIVKTSTKVEEQPKKCFFVITISILDKSISSRLLYRLRYIRGFCCHVRWVPCHHGMARPQVADGGDALQFLRVAENTILNKQSRGVDKGWSSSLGVGRGANNSSP